MAVVISGYVGGFLLMAGGGWHVAGWGGMTFACGLAMVLGALEAGLETAIRQRY